MSAIMTKKITIQFRDYISLIFNRTKNIPNLLSNYDLYVETKMGQILGGEFRESK